MDMIEQIEEALKMLEQVVAADTPKKRLAILKGFSENEFVDTLIDAMKDNAVQLENFPMPEPTEKNLPRVRLSNYLNMVKLIELIKKEVVINQETVRYLFTFMDNDEQNIYKSIITTVLKLEEDRQKQAKPIQKKKKKR